jgi:hypothetical protein
MGEVLIVRVVHIFCGMCWAGAAIVLAAFVEPALGALGPDAGKFMDRMMGRGRLGVFMSASATLAVLSGFRMLWLGSSGEPWNWWSAGAYGKAMVVGSAAGVIAMAVGLGMNAPTAAALARLGGEIKASGKAPSPEQIAEIARLHGRLQRAGILPAILLTITTMAMAAGRGF